MIIHKLVEPLTAKQKGELAGSNAWKSVTKLGLKSMRERMLLKQHSHRDLRPTTSRKLDLVKA